MHTMISTMTCSQELLAAIGSIAAESAYVERFIETLLYRLTGLDREIGEVLIEKGMMSNKIERLKEIGNAKLKLKKPQQEQLAKILKDLGKALNDRRIAIHGTWTPEITSDANGAPNFGPPRAHQRGKKGGAGKTLAATDALSVAQSIYDAHRALHTFSRKCWPEAFPEALLPPTFPPLPYRKV